jgi:hypothetical protein
MTHPNVVDVAAGPSLHQPHTLIFFLLAIGFLVVTVVPSFIVNRGRSWERRVFWSGVLGVTVSVFVAAIPYWAQAVGMALFSLAFMVAGAYAYTPFIKIRGKIYAFWVADSRPDPAPDGTAAPGSDHPDDEPAPDSYEGLVTARKHWWATVFTVVFCQGCVLAGVIDKTWWLATVGAAGLVVASAGYGYLDASGGYPIARGQRLQFVIAAVITAGAFPLLYLAGYHTGKRWPLRRKSAEYGAHARLPNRHR